MQAPFVNDFSKELLDYLSRMDESELNKALEILEKQEFKDLIFSRKSSQFDILFCIMNMSQERKNLALEVLQDPQCKDFIHSSNDALQKLNEFIYLDKDQRKAVLEILKKLDNDQHHQVFEMLNHGNINVGIEALKMLDKEHLNIALEAFNGADIFNKHLFLRTFRNVNGDLTKLPSLLKLPREALENLLTRDQEKLRIATTHEYIIPASVSQEFIVGDNNMIAETPQGQLLPPQASNLNATNIVPQLAFAATTAKMVQGLYGYFSNFFDGNVTRTNSSVIKHEAMDIENKLLSLSSKFKELHDKKLSEYGSSPNEAQVKEIKHLESRIDKANETLVRLDKFNKRSREEGEEILLRDAKEIFTDYKKLRKELKEINNLQNAKRLVHVEFKKADVKAGEIPKANFVNKAKQVDKTR